ncbi:pre-mRNA-processing-splicing factor 8-like [Cryptotermes secundus]|uniref:pre-mRNA-processing-splicing factor 8-like n=1 Tax=Cryptotermes secundus TaxID=105785 RepID=UPI000CD7D008|nr:pre-mRNA-processing-splicing factor 8-like [Cryptotermes secundus]
MDRLRAEYSVKSRHDGSHREELEVIREACDHPVETLVQIKRDLYTKRLFLEVGIEFMDFYGHLLPVCDVELQEELTDAFLDQVLELTLHL